MSSRGLIVDERNKILNVSLERAEMRGADEEFEAIYCKKGKLVAKNEANVLSE